ncbi:unnamed protein product [Effrenium voratum]|nr:unnamed protein product [Effrenium voratum]
MGAEASVPEPEDAEAAEQPDTDLLPENVAKMSYNEFNAALAGACREDDFRKYRDLWKHIDQTRSDNTSFDDALLADGGLKHLKYAFRHSDALWREAGVRMSRTFFHNREAREKLVALDFVGSMMLLTMPKDGVDLEDDGGLQQGTSEEQFQLLAAETILEMADYSEFMPSLCSTSVLNFLCIALNQVPPAVETVTHTFVKISADPLNLPVFLGGPLGNPPADSAWRQHRRPGLAALRAGGDLEAGGGPAPATAERLSARPGGLPGGRYGPGCGH